MTPIRPLYEDTREAESVSVIVLLVILWLLRRKRNQRIYERPGLLRLTLAASRERLGLLG